MFKAGDRVRVKPDYASEYSVFYAIGTVDTVRTREGEYPYWVIFDGHEHLDEWGFDEFELEAAE